MLRDTNLVPFSHQHQHALALSVRILRAFEGGDTGLRRWQSEIHDAFENEIEAHFQAEEQLLFPSAVRIEALRTLVSDLVAEHVMLRSYNVAALAMSLNRRDLIDFATALSNHVRKEEQVLFEQMQAELSPEELAAIGQKTRAFFREHHI